MNWRGLFSNGGTCGLIRWSAQNLTSLNKVLHGCRQSVSWDVLLLHVTDKTLQSFLLKIRLKLVSNLSLVRLEATKTLYHQRRRMRSSRHGPYRLGYACVTMAVSISYKSANWSKSCKSCLSSNCRLQLALHEGGIVSNRGSARHGECFRALYTPPVTSGEWNCLEV